MSSCILRGGPERLEPFQVGTVAVGSFVELELIHAPGLCHLIVAARGGTPDGRRISPGSLTFTSGSDVVLADRTHALTASIPAFHDGDRIGLAVAEGRGVAAVAVFRNGDCLAAVEMVEWTLPSVAFQLMVDLPPRSVALSYSSSPLTAAMNAQVRLRSLWACSPGVHALAGAHLDAVFSVGGQGRAEARMNPFTLSLQEAGVEAEEPRGGMGLRGGSSAQEWNTCLVSTTDASALHVVELVVVEPGPVRLDFGVAPNSATRDAAAAAACGEGCVLFSTTDKTLSCDSRVERLFPGGPADDVLGVSGGVPVPTVALTVDDVITLIVMHEESDSEDVFDEFSFQDVLPPSRQPARGSAHAEDHDDGWDIFTGLEFSEPASAAPAQPRRVNHGAAVSGADFGFDSWGWAELGMPEELRAAGGGGQGAAPAPTEPVVLGIFVNHVCVAKCRATGADAVGLAMSWAVVLRLLEGTVLVRPGGVPSPELVRQLKSGVTWTVQSPFLAVESKEMVCATGLAEGARASAIHGLPLTAAAPFVQFTCATSTMDDVLCTVGLAPIRSCLQSMEVGDEPGAIGVRLESGESIADGKPSTQFRLNPRHQTPVGMCGIFAPAGAPAPGAMTHLALFQGQELLGVVPFAVPADQAVHPVVTFRGGRAEDGSIAVTLALPGDAPPHVKARADAMAGQPPPAAVASGQPPPAAVASGHSACSVCLDNERTVLFQPCRHLACCEECARALSSCPLCRSPIHHTLRVFV